VVARALPDNAIVLTTSPTGRQVQSVLWGEINRMLSSPELLLDFPKADLAKLKIAEGHYAMGFATGPERAGVKPQGFHGKRVLVIIDEATGIDGSLWDGLEDASAGGEVRLLALCNPTTTNGPIHDIFTKCQEQWHCITISALDTPNFFVRMRR
jgi:hypothetical protein